jgi:hypothetical protein
MNKQKSDCNYCECVWSRIIDYSKLHSDLVTKRGKTVKYNVEVDIVLWQSAYGTQNTLYKQSKVQIFACLESMRLGRGPTEYPGTAQSYKWALLNNENIWIEL